MIGNQRRNLACRLRPADQVALDFRAAFRAQLLELIDGLHALGVVEMPRLTPRPVMARMIALASGRAESPRTKD